MKKVLLRIKLFFWFIGICVRYPLTIRENWQDMNTKYLFYTDDEFILLTKDLQETFNNIAD